MDRNTSHIRILQAALGAGVALALAAPAHAGLVFSDVNSSDPGQAESDFLNMFESAPVTESFEGHDVGLKSNPFTTSVGDFRRTGDPGDAGNTKCVGDCDELLVLDDDANENGFDGFDGPNFNGRYAVENGERDEDGKWLDSNDITEVTWDIALGSEEEVNAFGFYLMDPADEGATMELRFDDGSTDVITTIDDEPNGELFYIAGISDKSIVGASVVFENTDGNTDGDGWGIDQVTIGSAKVPEPTTLGLLGAGLLGLGMAARRARRNV